jgi:hypothetical protein
MSWIQVYISGLSRTIDPSDDDIETHLNTRYNLAPSEDVDSDNNNNNNANILWGGPGSSLIKRDDMGTCRGFGFLMFFSAEGASIVVDRINAYSKSVFAERGGGMMSADTSVLPLQLCAELSNPKSERKKTKKQDVQDTDLRMRRQRKAPVRKHPVIISSSGKKTNLGNKNR